MNEFNPDFERARARVLALHKQLKIVQRRYDEEVDIFKAKYPNAVIPTVE